jgi:hypothetical protein
MNRRSTFEVMHEPVSSLLARYGIQCRVKHDGQVTWYNLSKCPACRHEGYQCGVSESAGTDGKLYHGVKCFHAHDNPWNTQNPQYEDFLVRLGALTQDEANEISSYVKRNTHSGYPQGHRLVPQNPPQRRESNGGPGEVPRLLNLEFLGRLKKRLRTNEQAMRWLKEERGLEPKTVDRFSLGLSMPYQRKSGDLQENALQYPLIGNDGKFYNKYGYYNLPGVTQNPTDQNGWMPSAVRTYYADALGGKTSLFICEGAKDVWRHWQALSGSVIGSELLLITSTHGSAFPEEWKDPAFWLRWEKIYLGQDNDESGDVVAGKLAEIIGRDVRRVLVPKWYGKDWTDFWQSGGTVEEFSELLDEAPVISIKVKPLEEALPLEGYGRFAYEPLNINGAFHNGHLYCTAQVLSREMDILRKETGEEVVHDIEQLETVVIRSDRTVHSAMVMPARRGTKDKERVLRLTDGTLIEREPQPNKYGTWSWPSMSDYLSGKSQTRPLGAILADVEAHLRSSVWLPYDEDYAILALIVPVTYAQAVFDSVPLLFLNGPAGSGKSEMGRAMARICANAYICGQSSAASIARFIDESRGFVVLDDLEMIGNKGGEFTELVQALKLSYNKETAIKLWTDVKTMRTMLLNFYGVKMINNTTGVDQILGSRMLRIQTRQIPENMKKEFQGLTPTESFRLRALRDELHTWTFENVGRVDAEYRTSYPKNSDRSEEITAPLRVMAELAGNPELKSQLEVALTRQKQKAMDPDDPTEVLREALKNLIAQGYDMVAITHLVLEMRSLISQDYGKSFTNEIPRWAQPEWVGRMLRTFDLIDPDPSTHERHRVFGANLRFYPIRPSFIEEVRGWYEAQGTVIPVGTRTDPTDFCQICDSCPFRTLACEIMVRRKEVEADDRKKLIQLERGH